MTTRSEYITEQITRTETRLAEYLDAETQILNGAQSYSIGDRTLSRADLADIREQIEYLEKKLIRLCSNGDVRGVKVVFKDW